MYGGDGERIVLAKGWELMAASLAFPDTVSLLAEPSWTPAAQKRGTKRPRPVAASKGHAGGAVDIPEAWMRALLLGSETCLSPEHEIRAPPSGALAEGNEVRNSGSVALAFS